MKRLRIAIASAGRFHVLDLARELNALGHEVQFYSFVSRARARSFGLPNTCHTSLLPFVLPLLAWAKLAPHFQPSTRARMLDSALNRALTLRLKPCDVLIAMSGIYIEALRFAKMRYGARIWLERGSRHILSQDEILAAIPGAERPSAWTIKRELEGYALAERIVVASSHVEESFRRDEDAHRKLFLNPYGVDLAMFPPCAQRSGGGALRLLYVGAWSLRKGCDILAAAVRRVPGAMLTHVGSLGDVVFPDEPQFVHVASVPQHELSRYFCAADAFVLASREDGFGVVVLQALASGLPVICTDRTGGPDLRFTSALAERVSVVPHENVDALVEVISNMRDHLEKDRGYSSLSSGDYEALSWSAYARRYDAELQRDFAGS